MTRKELNIIILLAFTLGLLPFQAIADTLNNQDFSLSWPLGNGNDDKTAATMSTEGMFSVADFIPFQCGKRKKSLIISSFTTYI